MLPYQYGANNPVCNIDVNGDSIWFSKHYIDGKLNKLTMNVIGKVYNDTNKKIDMQSVSNYIKKGIERAFKGNFDDVVFETSVHLSVVNKMEDVLDDDHLFVLTDKIKNEKIAAASSSFGGKVAFIDLDLFTGLYDEALGSRNYGTFTATHEFGHLAGLVHETHNPFNVMRSGGHFYFTSSNQLQQIYNNWMSGLLNLGSNYMMQFGKKRPNVGKVSMFVTPF